MLNGYLMVPVSGGAQIVLREASAKEHRVGGIFVSPDLVPIAGGCDFDGAELTGSDHALHWIDFE